MHQASNSSTCDRMAWARSLCDGWRQCSWCSGPLCCLCWRPLADHPAGPLARDSAVGLGVGE